MSLAVPRPAEAERASMMLPTVTCSSCAAPIPISSLGEHVCQPMPAPDPAPTRTPGPPRPSQLQIPASRSSPRSPLAQSSTSTSSSSGSRPFAGPSSVSSASASGSRPSPFALDIPARGTPSRLPSPLSVGSGPQYLAQPTSAQPRTPSPTNPFFPHPDQGNDFGVVVHGLGLGVGASRREGEGPYPTDRQLPAGLNGPGVTEGQAGMAGVGRRAFAAAAWGVRAGVAMAQAGASRISPSDPHPPVPLPAPAQQHGRSATSPLPATTARTPSPPSTSTAAFPQPKAAPPASRQHVPPAAPLANRPMPSRKPSGSSVHIPERSISAMSQRSVPDQHRRKESVSSTGSQRSASASGKDDSISHLLKARAAGETAPAVPPKQQPFFEKYKQFVADADSRASPALGIKSGAGAMTSSPEHASLTIQEDEDEEESALPWATSSKPSAPVNPKPPSSTRSASHSRNPTIDSSSCHSSSSSSRNGGGSSGAESEEIVTPSQSWEGGFADRAIVGAGPNKRYHDPAVDTMEFGEEDEEGDEIIIGFTPSKDPSPQLRSQTVKTRPTVPEPTKDTYPTHARSQTLPITTTSSSTSRPGGSSSTSKRTKQCQKCLEIVGGSKRFVERDGVVLCEKDWKKLYLPSCRRCQLPIEKSAVSSSDGQLKGKWHKACFSCTKCSKPFAGDSFYVLGGKPWCQYHYHEENGTLCASASCRQPIEGACLITGEQRYHPGHLRCDKPGCRDRMTEYYEIDSRRYCSQHVNAAPGLSAGARAERRHTRLIDLPAGGGMDF